MGYTTLQHDDPANAQQRIVKTVDGGEPWSELPLIAAVGGFETSDGGKSWRPSTLAPKANKIRVRAADGKPMIYAIGSEVQIYR